MDNREKAKKVLDILEKEFPAVATALSFSNPLELLIATILSAQATDKLVNKVTGTLFKKYRTARDYSAVSPEDLERDIGSVNFYRNKAKSIRGCCKKIAEEFGGKVPDTLEGLVTLPGVGRKTANIVLGNAFGKNALAVDTHVKRVAQRLALTRSDDPDEIEADLTSVIPEKRWTKTTHLFIMHGRTTCKAKNPRCDLCKISGYCEYFKNVYMKSKS
ncbi:MAG: endonuclease III [Deltaproteobacteria bacterium]|nr:endonuclease III [Deltaproteobacteria bacterium]